MNKRELSIYLSYLLRHGISDIHVDMDEEGYVLVDELINGINQTGKYNITHEILEDIVRNDKKRRYQYSDDHHYIKANQGHSLPFVKVKLEYKEPPPYLYHGTTCEAFEKIKQSQAILKMSRHGVHLHDDLSAAIISAKRWHKDYVVLKIDALKMYHDGVELGVSENNVWICEKVLYNYIIEEIRGENNEI